MLIMYSRILIGQSTVFQTAFTTLFGFHCAFLFLRTGSLLPPILSHMFCNFMGLPGFGADLAAFPLKRNCTYSSSTLTAPYLTHISSHRLRVFARRSWLCILLAAMDTHLRQLVLARLMNSSPVESTPSKLYTIKFLAIDNCGVWVTSGSASPLLDGRP